MPNRILSTCSAATALAILFSASPDAAQAARCPLGEIFRPSRGICVTKDKAIQAGIYRGASHRTQAVQAAPAPEPAAQPAPKPRAQALAAIERRAPAPTADEALAFTAERKPAAAPIQNRNPQISPIVFRRPDPSPFGSLVALEPMP